MPVALPLANDFTNRADFFAAVRTIDIANPAFVKGNATTLPSTRMRQRAAPSIRLALRTPLARVLHADDGERQEIAMTLIPTKITFRGIEDTDALETDIRDRVNWLEQFYPGIVGCRVVAELPHRHRHDGRHFHVRIELTAPGGAPIVISHEPSLHGLLKDMEVPVARKDTEIENVHRYASVAIRQAFDAARRRLQDFAREQRGAVKVHDVPLHGTIAELSREHGFGFIQADEARVYFNRASVLDEAFDELAVGSPVAFVEEHGEKGPQASTVRLLGKHHYVGPSETTS